MTHKRTAVSLFSGAGGMDVGFESAGIEVVWANELMPHAAATYTANHRDGVMHCGPIGEFINQLPAPGSVFCVFGGPPCQGFSVAGKMDPSDERSQLVFAFFDAVKLVQPQVFVMENVKALATLSKFANVREELFRRARSLGYDAGMHVLNAKDFGVPQSRERVFFIGFKTDRNVRFTSASFDAYKQSPPSVGDILRAIGPAGTDNNPLTCKARITLAERPVMRRSPYAGMMFNGLGRPLNTDGVSCTLPASMGGNKTPVIDEAHLFNGEASWIEWYHSRLSNGEPPLGMNDAPDSLRRLTIKESIALQTFPSDYKFCGPISSQYTQIGNAVPCKLAYAVARAIIDAADRKPLKASAGQQALELA